MKITIKGIARLCDVSVTTVSRVLNHKTESMDSRTVDRIQKKIEELGYRPQALARYLIAGQSHVIGLVVPDNANPFFADLAKYMENIGYQKGYSVILCNSNYDPNKELVYVDSLMASQIDGVVYISTGMAGKTSEKLRESRITFVEVGHDIVGSRFGVISIDYQQGGYLAAKHLTELGHRRIGCISGGISYSHSEQRLDGYKKALEVAGIDFDPELVAPGDFRWEGGEAAMRNLLELPQAPTAVVAFNDMMAMGAMRVAKALGLKVPEDISITGYDNINFGRVADPPLTTIDHQVRVMAESIMKLLFDNISGKTEASETIYQGQKIHPSLIQRESTSRPQSGVSKKNQEVSTK